MKNNILTVILVVLVVVLGGASLLFGIGNAVSTSIAPLTKQITELTTIEKEIQRKLESRGNMDVSTSQLMFLTQRMAMLEARLGNNATGGNGGQQFPGQQQYGQQYPGQQRPMPSQEDFNKVYPIVIGTSPILGKPNAPVTIVEFSDFQCPFCARFHPVLKEVLKAYPDKVRVVIKNFPLPFHPNARPAAKLALSAGLQGKYFDMVDLLMQNGGSVENSKVKEYAKTLGLNYNKLMDDYKNKDAQWEKIIGDDMALANQINVHGTPTFFINGRHTSAHDLNSYKTEIDKI
jgi:protein-disulfide isomerase